MHTEEMATSESSLINYFLFLITTDWLENSLENWKEAGESRKTKGFSGILHSAS